jgi:hypothetical protein
MSMLPRDCMAARSRHKMTSAANVLTKNPTHIPRLILNSVGVILKTRKPGISMSGFSISTCSLGFLNNLTRLPERLFH